MDSVSASLSLQTNRVAEARSNLDPVQNRTEQAARDAAQSFEAMFIAQMLEHMSQGVGTNSLFGGGSSETIYKGMLNEQYAQEISNKGGVGIADAVYREILKLQEV